MNGLGGYCDSPGALRLQGTGSLWEHIAGIFCLRLRSPLLPLSRSLNSMNCCGGIESYF